MRDTRTAVVAGLSIWLSLSSVDARGGEAVAAAPEELTPIAIRRYVGPESSLTAPVLTSAFRRQFRGDIATDGALSFAVWLDEREGSESDLTPGIYGARIDSEGRILDPAGIAIAGVSSLAPAVVWNGTNFLVSWDSFPSDEEGTYVALVDRSGEILKKQRLTELRSFGFSRALLASNRRTSMVVLPRLTHAHWFVIDYEAKQLSEGQIDLSGLEIRDLMIASNGGDYVLAVLTDALRTYRITENGSVTAQAAIAISGSAKDFHLTWGDDRFVAAWSDDGTLYAASFDRQGNLQSAPRRIFEPARDLLIRSPHVSWQRNHFLITYMLAVKFPICFPVCDAIYDIEGVFLDRGLQQETFPRRISSRESSERDPRAVSHPEGAVIVWSDDETADVYATLLTLAGRAEEALLSKSAARQTSPAAANNGDVYLAAWAEARTTAGTSAIVVTTITAEGQPAGGTGTGTVISNPSASPTSYRGTRVASDGHDFLVLWIEETFNGVETFRKLYARRISSAGTAIDPSPVLLGTTSATEAALTFDGSDYVLFWSEQSKLLATRLSPRGEMAPAVIEVAAIPKPATDLAVDSEGPEHLVVWSDGDVHAGFVPRSLSGLSSVPDLSTVSLSSDSPSVAFDHDGYLIAWATRMFLNGPTLIRATRLTMDGHALDVDPNLGGIDGAGIGVTESIDTDPKVVFDGQSHLIFWTDLQAGRTTVSGARIFPDTGVPPWTPGDDARGQRISRFTNVDGDVVGFANWGATAGGLLGTMRLAREAQFGGVQRIFVRRIVAIKRHRSVTR